MKQILSRHPIIFTSLVTALIIDLSGVARGIIPGASFFLGSILAVAFFLGIASAIRVIAGRPVHVAITWVIMVLLYLCWFVLQAAISGDTYHPSFLLMLCVVAAFKTLRLQEEP